MDEQTGMQYLPVPMQQSSSASDEYGATLMHQQRIENLISQLNPEILLTDIEHRICRRRKNVCTGEWESIVKNDVPVSSKMVSDIISYLSSFLTNNVTFSNFTEQEINRIMRLVILDIVCMLNENEDEYNLVDNNAEKDRITQIIFTSIYAALKRALKGNEASKFWKALSISGDIDTTTPEKKNSIKDILKLW